MRSEKTCSPDRHEESYSHEMANRDYLTAEIYVFYNYVLAVDDVTHIMFLHKLI